MRKGKKPMKKQKDSNLVATQCRLVETFWNFWPAFQRWADACIDNKKLTPQRTRILARLKDQGPQIMSELGEYLGVSATNVTALVDGLEKEGLVARKPHPSDRRATVIEITAAAADQVSEGCSMYRERVGQLFSSLSETERKELLRLMELVKERLDAPEDKPAHGGAARS